MDGYEQLANLMKALAHPVRLQILEVLGEEGEACVCHLEGRLHQRQAYISQQLAKLREVGLVDDRREGLNVFYSLAEPDLLSLIEMAKRIVGTTAPVREIGSSFPAIRRIDRAQCPCPICQADTALKESGR